MCEKYEQTKKKRRSHDRRHSDKSLSCERRHSRISSTKSKTKHRASRSNSSRISRKKHRPSEDVKSTQKSTVTKTKKTKWDVPILTDLNDFAGDVGLDSLNAMEDVSKRRLYISNIPLGSTEAAILQFFNGAILTAAGCNYAMAAMTGQLPTLKAEMGPRKLNKLNQFVLDNQLCCIELRTAAYADICLKLNGIPFNGSSLKISRTSNVQDNFNDFMKTYDRGQSDLPLSMNESELRTLFEQFGKVESVSISKDYKGNSMVNCGTVLFESVAAADAAIKGLQGKQINGKTPTYTKESSSSMVKDMSKNYKPPLTSSIVTELPTSMTHKIFTNAIVGAQVQAARRDGSIPSLVVQLLNCVFPEDLIDDNDFNSILKDIEAEATAFGTVLNIKIPRPPANLTFKPGVGKVFIHYADITAARKAQSELNGRRFENRRVICAAFFPVEEFLKEKFVLM